MSQAFDISVPGSGSAFLRPRPRRVMRSDDAEQAASTFVPKGNPPRSVEEVRTYLANLEGVLVEGNSPDAVLEGALSYLVANAPGWTYEHRERLRQAIVSRLDVQSVGAVFEQMKLNPRTDVLDACELILRSGGPEVLEATKIELANGDLPAAARARLLGAIARSAPSDACVLLTNYLDDRDPEVRAAAAELVGELEIEGARAALIERREVESSYLVTEALREALESLPL